MVNPLISIVVCTYNRANLLRQTIESILAQRYEPVEIVVVDDGSTDNTQELMARYANIVRYFRQENQGIASVRNIGCHLAKGEFIAFQDDDDLMLPDRLVVLYEALCRHPSAVLAVGDWAVIDNDGNLTGRRWMNPIDEEKDILIEDGYTAVLWPKVPAAPCTTLFRRIDGDRIGWFDNMFTHSSEDKDFFARLGKLGPFVYVPKVVNYLRRGHESLTSNRALQLYRQLRLFEKHLSSADPHLKSLRKRLQYRVLLQVRQIASYIQEEPHQSDEIPPDYLGRVLSLMGFWNRLRYRWFSLVKLPLKTLLQRLEAKLYCFPK